MWRSLGNWETEYYGWFQIVYRRGCRRHLGCRPREPSARPGHHWTGSMLVTDSASRRRCSVLLQHTSWQHQHLCMSVPEILDYWSLPITIATRSEESMKVFNMIRKYSSFIQVKMIRILCFVWYIKYIKVQEVYTIHIHFSQILWMLFGIQHNPPTIVGITKWVKVNDSTMSLFSPEEEP